MDDPNEPTSTSRPGGAGDGTASMTSASETRSACRSIVGPRDPGGTWAGPGRDLDGTWAGPGRDSDGTWAGLGRDPGGTWERPRTDLAECFGRGPVTLGKSKVVQGSIFFPCNAMDWVKTVCCLGARNHGFRALTPSRSLWTSLWVGRGRIRAEVGVLQLVHDPTSVAMAGALDQKTVHG